MDASKGALATAKSCRVKAKETLAVNEEEMGQGQETGHIEPGQGSAGKEEASRKVSLLWKKT